MIDGMVAGLPIPSLKDRLRRIEASAIPSGKRYIQYFDVTVTPAHGSYVTSTMTTDGVSEIERISLRAILGHTQMKAANLSEQLRELGSLSDNFNGYGSEAPNDTSIELALMVVEASGSLTPSRMSASAEGGIDIYFVRDGKHGDIECFNSGEIIGTISDDKGLPEVWDIRAGEIASAINKIAGFLER